MAWVEGRVLPVSTRNRFAPKPDTTADPSITSATLITNFLFHIHAAKSTPINTPTIGGKSPQVVKNRAQTCAR